MALKEKHTNLMFTVCVFVQGGGAVWWPIIVDGSKKRQCCLLFPLHLEEVGIYIYIRLSREKIEHYSAG